MSGVAAVFAVEVNRRVAAVVGRLARFQILALETLERRQASTSVPSTVKCSSESNCMARACATTRVKNSRATSCSSSRARLREKLEWSKLGSAASISRNQRNNRL